jgi:hypothetical protein
MFYPDGRRTRLIANATLSSPIARALVDKKFTGPVYKLLWGFVHKGSRTVDSVRLRITNTVFSIDCCMA